MWDWDSKGLVHSVALGQTGTGPQREWYTVRLGLNGTGIQCGTGKEWDRNLEGMVHNGTGILTGTIIQRGTGTEWDKDSEGMVHSGTGTQMDWYTVWDRDSAKHLRGNGTQ